MSRSRRLWFAMAVLALLIAAYALTLLLLPATRPPFLRAHALRLPLTVGAHLLGSAVALALGPWQLAPRFRAASLARHRLLGRIYLVSVLVGGVAGVRLAVVSQGGAIAHAGFAALGVAWLTTALAAYVAIRRGEPDRHRAWMYRNYALTFAAVTLRIYLPASLALGIPFAVAYPAIAWLCWLPNLLVAELRFVPGSP